MIVLIATNATPHLPHVLPSWRAKTIPTRGKNIFLTWPQMSRNFDPQEITAFRWFAYDFLIVSLRQTLRVEVLINDLGLGRSYQIG